MAVAITADGLSKRYRIGELHAAYGTLRESMTHATRRLLGRERRHHEEIWALATSRCKSTRARSSASSAETAPASPRSSRS